MRTPQEIMERTLDLTESLLTALERLYDEQPEVAKQYFSAILQESAQGMARDLESFRGPGRCMCDKCIAMASRYGIQVVRT